MNDYDVQLVTVLGEFVWHNHDDTNDFFLVLHGSLTIQRDGDLTLGPANYSWSSRGVAHRRRCDEKIHLLLIEPSGTPNTRDAGGELRATKEDI